MFRISSLTRKEAELTVKIDPNSRQIFPEDQAALKEIEIQRFKWNAFLKGKKGIWADEWLWQKRIRRTASGMHLRKKFMQIFSSREKSQKQLKELIRSGVPPELRGRVWWACSGAEAKMKDTPKEGQFNELLKRLPELEDSQIALDIEKDLNRTFPEYIKPEDTAIIDSLRRVLLVYALRNEIVGYCQSMNYICALILFHIEDEERTFWLFSALLEDILPPDYYVPTLIGGRVDQMVFQSCIAWKLPRLHAAFKETNTILEPIICPWFLCLYINVLPPFAVCRVWDCLFWEGSLVLFRIGLALMKSKMKYLMEAPDFISVYSILKTSGNKICSFELESADHSTADDVQQHDSSSALHAESTAGCRILSPTSSSAFARAASAFSFSSPSPRESTTTTNSSIATAGEVGGMTGISNAISVDDAAYINSTKSSDGATIMRNRHSASPDPSLVRISDAEHLIKSAFGYRWLKSVPRGKVELLRRKFFRLLDEPRVKASSGTTSIPASASKGADNGNAGGNKTAANTATNAQIKQRTVSFGTEEVFDDSNDSDSNGHSNINSGKGRVRFTAEEDDTEERDGVTADGGRKGKLAAAGSSTRHKSSKSLDEVSMRATQGTIFDFDAAAAAIDGMSDYDEDAEVSSCSSPTSPGSTPYKRSISDQNSSKRFSAATNAGSSMYSTMSEDRFSMSSSSVRTRQSMVMLRLMGDNDLQSLMELARELDEGLGSHVEQFARELDSADSSRSTASRRRSSAGGKHLQSATAAAAVAAAYDASDADRRKSVKAPVNSKGSAAAAEITHACEEDASAAGKDDDHEHLDSEDEDDDADFESSDDMEEEAEDAGGEECS